LVCPHQDALPVGNGLAKPGPVLFPQDALRLQQESSGSGAGAVVATVGCSVLGMMLAGGIWSWRSQMGSSSYSAEGLPAFAFSKPG